MEIYFYVLIAAVYLILGFVSADGGLPGIGKMASFIYEKTGGILRGRKAGRFLRENGLRRDLAILYPFGRTQQEARRFYIERSSYEKVFETHIFCNHLHNGRSGARRYRRLNSYYRS